MGKGCALIAVIFLIMAFFAAIATIPEHGLYGVGIAALIGYVIYALLIKPIVEDRNKSDKSEWTCPPSNKHNSGTNDNDDDW